VNAHIDQGSLHEGQRKSRHYSGEQFKSLPIDQTLVKDSDAGENVPSQQHCRRCKIEANEKIAVDPFKEMTIFTDGDRFQIVPSFSQSPRLGRHNLPLINGSEVTRDDSRGTGLNGLPLESDLVLFPEIVGVEKSNPGLGAGTNAEVQPGSHVPSLLLQYNSSESRRDLGRAISAIISDDDYFGWPQRLSTHTSNSIRDEAFSIVGRNYNRDRCDFAVGQNLFL
jgi:hypothetical protein